MVFRLGRVLPEAKGPGVVLVVAPIDRIVRMSLRIKALEVPAQDMVTRDSVTVKVNVARSPEEAELQAQGIDVMASMFEREEAGFTEEFVAGAEPGTLPEESTEETPAAEASAEEAGKGEEA